MGIRTRNSKQPFAGHVKGIALSVLFIVGAITLLWASGQSASEAVNHDSHVGNGEVSDCGLQPTIVDTTSESPSLHQDNPTTTPRSQPIQLCQALGPAAPHDICGIDCWNGQCAQGECSQGSRTLRWKDAGPIDWQQYAQGEYVGQARLAHVKEYRLRVDDQLDFVYRLTRDRVDRPYKLNIGDEIQIESFTDEKLNRTLIVQPDGTITLPGLGQVPAWGLTVPELLKDLEKRYEKWYKPPAPALTVTPIKVNTKLDDLRASVDARAGEGGQRVLVRVTPEGTIQLPALGSVHVQGLTLSEVKQEVDERYVSQAKIDGIEITPILTQRAPRFVYVVGEVKGGGRFQLEGPTTLMQAIALAGGWNVGANLRQVVVFRRGDDWRLMATMLDIRGALYANSPCPADEIWLADSDIVVVPKHPILVVDEFIDLVFTRGIYGVMPNQGVSFNFGKLSTL